jgi:uncharacterized membrane-anchored protein YitT (DUF2179 family)
MGHLFARNLCDKRGMARLIFAVLWTLLTAAILLGGGFAGSSQGERLIFALFPIFGLFFTWLSWLHLRRSRSLRTEIVGGVTVYVWIDFNGREERSTADPRPEWDAGDGDGDSGDGAGGD